MKSTNILTVGLAQISPVWLDKAACIDKTAHWMHKAADRSCDLVVFGEALIPGYPFWVELTQSPEFNSPVQKELYSFYAQNAVRIEEGHLDLLCKTARQRQINTYVGIIERPAERGGHSLYCSLVFIDREGNIRSVHRKLMPTYEERLVWAIGDGNGLKVHRLGDFHLGGLNCWENWMPMARTTLYAAGENVHVAVWPGSDHNTREITRFIALESRSYVLSASALMTKKDIGNHVPHAELILKNSPEILTNGGSCIAGPDGEWIVEPQTGKEELIVSELTYETILEERQNFDPSGHYARPDVFQLNVENTRQFPVRNIDKNL